MDIEKIKEANTIVDSLIDEVVSEIANTFISTKAQNGNMRCSAFAQRLVFASKDYENLKQIKSIFADVLKAKRGK